MEPKEHVTMYTMVQGFTIKRKSKRPTNSFSFKKPLNYLRESSKCYLGKKKFNQVVSLISQF